MEQPKNKVSDWRPALLLMGQISGWIVGPVLLALFLGRYLDERYRTEPWFFLGLTLLAFLISCSAIIKIARAYIKDLEKQLKQDKKHEQSDK